MIILLIIIGFILTLIVSIFNNFGSVGTFTGALIQGILSTQVEYSGPIPPPKMLHQYEVVMPGSMERIVSMAENEQAHRHKIDNKIVETEARDGLLGIISAFIISMSLIVGGIVVIIVVPSTVATVVGGVINLTGIATISKTFIGGTRK